MAPYGSHFFVLPTLYQKSKFFRILVQGGDKPFALHSPPEVLGFLVFASAVPKSDVAWLAGFRLSVVSQ